MRRAAVAVLGLLAILGTGFRAHAEPKARIAVIEFTEKGSHSHHWYGHVGKATEDWFVDSLVNTQKFKVMERQQLKAIYDEKGFQLSGDVDPLTAVKVGKMAGVQFVVFGNIDFAQKQQEVHSGGGITSRLGLPNVWGGAGKRTSEGNLTARVVNVQSGEIVFSKSETVAASNLKVSVMGTGGGTDWDETVVRKVFQPAVERITQEMVAKIGGMMETLGGSATGVEGKVVLLRDGMVYINLGKLDGIKRGDEFQVIRVEIISDPDTKQELGREEKALGRITVEKIAGDHLAACKGEAALVAKGDVVTKK